MMRSQISFPMVDGTLMDLRKAGEGDRRGVLCSLQG